MNDANLEDFEKYKQEEGDRWLTDRQLKRIEQISELLDIDYDVVYNVILAYSMSVMQGAPDIVEFFKRYNAVLERMGVKDDI